MHDQIKTEAIATSKLAIPLIIGQATNVAMVFVDTLMAGRLSALDLAAVAIGGTIWSSLTLFLIGVLLSVPSFVSQYDGAEQRDRISSFIRQTIWLAVSIALLIIVAVYQAHWIMSAVGIDTEVIPLASKYLRAVAWGAVPLAVFLVMRLLSDGLSLTRPTMILGLLGLLLNIPADYVFMYGKLGLPAMGAEGCGYATALVLVFQAICATLYIARAKAYRFLKLFSAWEKPNLLKIKEILHVGIPIGLSVFVESSMFLYATLLMGSLGVTEVGAHQIALNFSALAFMVPLGLAMAITVRVGNSAGRQDWQQVKFRAKVGFGLTLFSQTCSGLIIFIFANQIARLYTPDPQVIAIAVELLFFAALFQFPDGLQVAAAGALRGIKDTRIPMLMMIAAYWIVGIPTSYGLGIQLGHAGSGIWIGLIVGLSFAAVTLLIRFFRLSGQQTKSQITLIE